MMERGQVHERAPKASPDAVSWHTSVWKGRLSPVPDATDLSLVSIKAVNAKHNRLCVDQEFKGAAKSIPDAGSSRFTAGGGQCRRICPPNCSPSSRTDRIQFQLSCVMVVGASGFEPPTSWSRTRKIPRINNLEVGIVIASDCYRFRCCNDLHRKRPNRSQCIYAQGRHSFGHSRGLS
jgi:hypothetical protein